MNLKNVLNSVANDVVALVKQDGTRTENVKAVVQSTDITIFDTSLNVEEGDRIERRLPSRRVESYLILDTGFNPSHRPVPAFYHMKVRKESVISDDRGSSSVVYNLTGPNARVNVNSIDSSTNVTNVNSAELFVKMRDAAADIQDSERRQLIVERIEEMNCFATRCGRSRIQSQTMQLGLRSAAAKLPGLRTDRGGRNVVK